ncbi:MAG: hypothetical protein DWQ05_09425 [Calditrichaeota bacterium]|nr:MAG: hypothetical protein DWQ05_09425 [Calditrichota bacterium]
MTMKHNTILIFLLLIFIAAPSVCATEVTPRNAQELTQLAQRLFHGRCISVKEHFQPNSISYTEYTFEVLTPVKGVSQKTITFKQFGLINPVQLKNDLLFLGKVSGMPVYQKGKEYLLFLMGDSKLGLTSPAGLFQGSFNILNTGDGEKRALNSLGNKGLFKNIQSEDQTLLKKVQKNENTGGQVTLNEFMDLIRSFINE